MKIIFLDIDGVLNCENAYTRRITHGFCQYRDFIVNDKTDHYQTFYPPSKNLLNKLIEETGAKIVVSSTWRSSGIDWLKSVWKEEQMNGEIIGITPNFRHDKFSVPRGSEIKWWLENTKNEIENYIIIDDDSDMLYNQRNNFVHVLSSPENKSGFNRFYYKEALKKLNVKK